MGISIGRRGSSRVNVLLFKMYNFQAITYIYIYNYFSIPFFITYNVHANTYRRIKKSDFSSPSPMKTFLL